MYEYTYSSQKWELIQLFKKFKNLPGQCIEKKGRASYPVETSSSQKRQTKATQRTNVRFPSSAATAVSGPAEWALVLLFHLVYILISDLCEQIALDRATFLPRKLADVTWTYRSLCKLAWWPPTEFPAYVLHLILILVIFQFLKIDDDNELLDE